MLMAVAKEYFIWQWWTVMQKATHHWQHNLEICTSADSIVQKARSLSEGEIYFSLAKRSNLVTSCKVASVRATSVSVVVVVLAWRSNVVAVNLESKRVRR